MKAIQQESPTAKKKKDERMNRLKGRRLTIIENAAAKQKKAEFTSLEKDFKKKWQSLRKDVT